MVNAEIVAASIDAVWVRGDLDALDRYWTPECVNHAAPAGAREGLAALRSYHAAFAQQLGDFADVAIRIVQQVSQDDRVATHLVTTGRHAGSGASALLTTMRVDRLEGGRIAEHWSVADLAGLGGMLATERVARSYVEASNRQDHEFMASLFAEDAEWIPISPIEPRRGRAAIRERYLTEVRAINAPIVDATYIADAHRCVVEFEVDHPEHGRVPIVDVFSFDAQARITRLAVYRR